MTRALLLYSLPAALAVVAGYLWSAYLVAAPVGVVDRCIGSPACLRRRQRESRFLRLVLVMAIIHLFVAAGVSFASVVTDTDRHLPSPTLGRIAFASVMPLLYFAPDSLGLYVHRS